MSDQDLTTYECARIETLLGEGYSIRKTAKRSACRCLPYYHVN